MDALIKKDHQVVCPFCTFDKYLVIRRLLDDENRLIKRCRCQACGDLFEFAENKEGFPVQR